MTAHPDGVDVSSLRCVVFGTAGHIDHGKTTLLKALTGIDADRLKEEKERGITIDLGFAPWISPPYAIGFVDVPGHERFIGNMLAGAGGIDAVLLVVAADEGVMPQTREHLEIVSLLGIRRGIVALTKIDAVEPGLADLAEEEVRDGLRSSFLEGAPIVRTGAMTGEGLDELAGRLRRLADEIPPRASDGVARMHVDRVFTSRGHGTVVTGTVLSGRFSRGQIVRLHPEGQETKVRAIHVYGQSVEEASSGRRAALNLQGVSRDGVKRGDTVTSSGPHQPTRMFFARAEVLQSYGKVLKNLAPVHVYIGAGEYVGRVRVVGRTEIEAGGWAFVQIRLESPAMVWPRDRFVMRQYSPLVTLGGGEVLAIHASAYRPSLREEIRDYLEDLDGASPRQTVALLMKGQGLRGLTVEALADRAGLSTAQALARMGELGAAGEAVELEGGAGWVESGLFEALRKSFGKALEESRMQAPVCADRAGDIRRRLPRFGDPLWKSLLLAEGGESRLTAGASGTEVDPDEEVLASLKSTGMEGMDRPGLLSGLGRDGDARLALLVREKRVLRVGEDYFLHPGTLEEALDRIRREVPAGGGFGVGHVKEWFGLTRKRGIPFLEYLDRAGITFRVGDERRLRQAPAR